MHQARKLAASISVGLIVAVLPAAGAARPAQNLPPPDAVTLNAHMGTGYRIISQDVLDITVLQAPELSKSVTVDDEGNIALPFLGNHPVANKTPKQVSD